MKYILLRKRKVINGEIYLEKVGEAENLRQIASVQMKLGVTDTQIYKLTNWEAKEV